MKPGSEPSKVPPGTDCDRQNACVEMPATFTVLHTTQNAK